MTVTLKTLLADARQGIPEQRPQQVKQRIEAREPLALIDVRDPDEYRDGAIEPATNISRGFLGMRFREVRLRRDPDCPLCGVSPSIIDLSGHAEGGELYCEAPAVAPAKEIEDRVAS